MAEVNGCRLPEDVYYWVDKHVWMRLDGGEAVVGMTDPAQKLAGKILYVNPRKPGKAVEKGQSVGTVESAKYVGPVPAPVSGEVVAVNESIRKDGSLVNRDPYGEGWVARIRPSRLAEEMGDLLTGADAVAAYRDKLAAENIRCDS